MDIKKKILSTKHPDMLISMANLSYIYWSQERHGEAFDLMKLAWELCARAIGENHPKTIAVKETLEAWTVFQDNTLPEGK